MERLHVAIVDDEPWIVRGIARSCDWAAHGAELTLQLTEPEEAIRRIIAEKPDIVLTDVNMGRVSGLELMERVRMAGVNCEFVVISGYDEFAYAQRAMELGASHYLLKPLKREELASVMARLSARIARERAGTGGGDDVTEWLSLRDIESHAALFSHAGIRCAGTGWQAAVLDGESLSGSLEDFRSAGIPFIALDIGRRRQTLFFSTDQDLSGPGAPACFRQFAGGMTIGFSAHHPEDCHPALNWQEADLSLDGRFVFPERTIHCWRKQPEKMRAVLEQFLRAFEHPSEILLFLSGFGTHARENEYGIGDVLWVYNLFCITWNHAGPGEGTERFAVATPQELTALFRNVDEMGAYLCEAAAGLLRDRRPNVPVTGARFEELLRHVQAHFAEPLYLSDLAEVFHYNSTYVSDLFRKHLGHGFSEYLTLIRMNRAREILRGTDLPVTEVAAQCGYPDACHFTRQFRKTTGLAPRAFRNLVPFVGGDAGKGVHG